MSNRAESYINNTSWRVKENSSIQYSLGGLILHLSGAESSSYWLNNVYNEKIRNAHKNGSFHIHDLSMISTYSYFGAETVLVKSKDYITYQSFRSLYDYIKCDEILLNKDDNAYVKYPEDLTVYDNGKWTKISRITKKKKRNNFVFVKGSNGFSQIVTKNHPVITTSGKKIAENITVNDDKIITYLPKLDIPELVTVYIGNEILKNKSYIGYTINGENLTHNNCDDIDGLIGKKGCQSCVKNRVIMDKDMGWLFGIIISDAYITSKKISILQNEGEILEKIKLILNKNNISYSLSYNNNTRVIRIKSTVFCEFVNLVLSAGNAKNKKLPIDMFRFGKEFLKGVVGGVIDGEGTKHGKSSIMIRMASREFLNQLSFFLRLNGYTIRDYKPYFNDKSKTGFKSNFYMYGISFAVGKNTEKFNSIKLINMQNEAHENPEKFTNGKYDSGIGEKDIINANSLDLFDEEWVYDITTDTHTFMCNGIHSHNCSGWSLRDLLLKGLGGVEGKITSAPAKHLNTLINQMINFLGILQNESAGAQAFSSVDTYLAPFVRADKLTYKEVKQHMQNLVFGLNVSSRWGCVTPDTEILTNNGWKTYDEIKIGESTLGFNIKTKKVIKDKIKNINVYNLNNSELLKFSNRSQEQLLTNNHKMIRKEFNKDYYVSSHAEHISKYKTPIDIPIAGFTDNKENTNIDDNELKLYAWVIAEGSLIKDGIDQRTSIYQSHIVNGKYCNEIRIILNNLGIGYNESVKRTAWGKKCIRFRLSRPYSKKLNTILGKDKLPMNILRKCSTRQIRSFIDEYRKGDGEKLKFVIHTKQEKIKNDFQELAVMCGLGTHVTVDKKRVFRIQFLSKGKQVLSLKYNKKIKYSGIVWCPTTESSFWVARRKGSVFITGNSQPIFSNFTFDWNVPNDMKNHQIILGGEMQKEKYKDYQKEMDIINKAFLEVYLEGDSQGRSFAYPIPTYNITNDFDWEHKNCNLLFELTRKYGIPYFQNFISSDLNPGEVRSMCCFDYNTSITCLYNDKIKRIVLGRLSEKKSDYTLKVRQDNKWVNATVVKLPYNDKLLNIKLRNGMEYNVTKNHVFPTKEKDKQAKDLEIGDSLLYSSNYPEYGGVGSYNLGKLLGLYLAEGSHLGNTSIQFSIGEDELEILTFIVEKSSELFAATFSLQPNRGKSTSVFINSKSFRAFIDRFVSGKAIDKKLINYDSFNKLMLRGIFDGWFSGDGKYDGSEAYSCSEVLINQMSYIANALGFLVNKRSYNRITTIKNKSYESTIFTLHLCKNENDGGFIYSNIGKRYGTNVVSIEECNKNTEWVYCLEILDNSPYFNLSDGLYTHNCRLRLDKKELYHRGGGLFGSNELTGSVGVCTINLPRIGFISKKKKSFYKELSRLMTIAKDSLELKRKKLIELADDNLYPYTKVYLPKGWKTHFSTIGLIGMHECCLNFLEKGIDTKEGKKFAEEILTYMNKKCVEFQKETGNLYNLEATPAEGASYRLAKHDKNNFSDIITSGTYDSPFYTNSTWLPVDYSEDIFSILDHQESLQKMYSGGTVVHVLLNNALPDRDCVKELVKKICYNYKVPYVTISNTYSICKLHGYISGNEPVCPTCGGETEVFARIVGYYRPVKNWNKGKTQEFKERKLFDTSVNPNYQKASKGKEDSEKNAVSDKSDITSE